MRAGREIGLSFWSVAEADQGVLGAGAAGIGGLGVEFDRAVEVGGNAMAVLVVLTQQELTIGVAFVGSLADPFERLAIVLLDVQTLGIELADIGAGDDGASRGRFSVPFHGQRRILVDALANL